MDWEVLKFNNHMDSTATYSSVFEKYLYIYNYSIRVQTVRSKIFRKWRGAGYQSKEMNIHWEPSLNVLYCKKAICKEPDSSWWHASILDVHGCSAWFLPFLQDLHWILFTCSSFFTDQLWCAIQQEKFFHGFIKVCNKMISNPIMGSTPHSDICCTKHLRDYHTWVAWTQACRGIYTRHWKSLFQISDWGCRRFLYSAMSCGPQKMRSRHIWKIHPICKNCKWDIVALAMTMIRMGKARTIFPFPNLLQHAFKLVLEWNLDYQQFSMTRYCLFLDGIIVVHYSYWKVVLRHWAPQFLLSWIKAGPTYS